MELIDKGRYRLKAIYDHRRSSGTWTTGDFNLMKRPRACDILPLAELDVKINWELEQDWDLGSHVHEGCFTRGPSR
ncbi:MAG: hypothetical protein MZV63_31160 [Marinilabiliales bacterium]|nr:hypothetical protein [Marinilabiliales bacterium]